MLNNQSSLLACASTGWNIQWLKWIAQKHQKSMFESGKIRVRLAIEIMSHLDAYNFPAEWKAKWHVARFSLRSLFPRAACSRCAALPASPTHVSSLILCITLFQLMLGDIHIPAVHIFLRRQSSDMLYVCLRQCWGSAPEISVRVFERVVWLISVGLSCFPFPEHQCSLTAQLVLWCKCLTRFMLMLCSVFAVVFTTSSPP